MKKILFTVLLLGLLWNTGWTKEDATAETDYPKEALEEGVYEGVLLMREEEKMARDVYKVLLDTWGKQVFRNIHEAETRHMALMGGLIEELGLKDPVEKDVPGVFQNPVLVESYNAFVGKGTQSLEDAFLVGMAIEEMDIRDLMELIEETEDARITEVYGYLLKGSQNHLRAFYRQLQMSGISAYEPQYLDRETFDEILRSPHPNGKGMTY